MSFAPTTVGFSEFAIFLETNEPVPFRPLFDFLAEIETLARQPNHLGDSAVMEVLEIQTGTKFVRLTFESKVAVAALAVAILALANDVASGMTKPSGALAESAAAMCVSHGVVECVVTTSQGQIRISRNEMPAVQLLEAQSTGNAFNADEEGGLIEVSATIDGPAPDGTLEAARRLEGVEDAHLQWDGVKSTLICETRYGGGQARELQRQMFELLDPSNFD